MKVSGLRQVCLETGGQIPYAGVWCGNISHEKPRCCRCLDVCNQGFDVQVTRLAAGRFAVTGGKTFPSLPA